MESSGPVQASIFYSYLPVAYRRPRYGKCVMDKVLFRTQENKVDLHNLDGGLLILSKLQSAFPSATKCQSQLQSPQSVTLRGSWIYPILKLWSSGDRGVDLFFISFSEESVALELRVFKTEAVV